MLKSAHTEFLIAALALLLFVPGLGAVNLFDWDEINFAECAREMADMVLSGPAAAGRLNVTTAWSAVVGCV